MLTSDFKKALAYLEAGQSAEALPILSQIIERWPNYAAAQVAYAQALQETENPLASFFAWAQAESLVSHSDVVRAGLLSSAEALAVDVDNGPAVGVRHPDAPSVVGVDAPSGSRPDVEESAPAAIEPEGMTHDEPGPDLDEQHRTPDESKPAALESAETDSEGGDPGPQQHELPEYDEGSEMDPALFVPIAVPIDPTVVPDTEGAEWVGESTLEAESSEVSATPEWEGGYEGASGDGAGPDFDVDTEEPTDEADLDRLIDELEAARIVPADDPSSIPAPDLSDDIDDVVSETLARIYATQKQFSEAARVYERLALENPDRAEEFAAKASEMRGRSQ
jgi:tetratricopeptide (TPR) repeat protein